VWTLPVAMDRQKAPTEENHDTHEVWSRGTVDDEDRHFCWAVVDCGVTMTGRSIVVTATHYLKCTVTRSFGRSWPFGFSLYC
jgi:hypothetical protein